MLLVDQQESKRHIYQNKNCLILLIWIPTKPTNMNINLRANINVPISLYFKLGLKVHTNPT